MTRMAKNKNSVPGMQLEKTYRAWLSKLPELQELIKDPKWSNREIRQFSARIENLKSGIETFEKLYPKYAVKKIKASKGKGNAGSQASLF